MCLKTPPCRDCRPKMMCQFSRKEMKKKKEIPPLPALSTTVRVSSCPFLCRSARVECSTGRYQWRWTPCYLERKARMCSLREMQCPHPRLSRMTKMRVLFGLTSRRTAAGFPIAAELLATVRRAKRKTRPMWHGYCSGARTRMEVVVGWILGRRCCAKGWR